MEIEYFLLDCKNMWIAFFLLKWDISAFRTRHGSVEIRPNQNYLKQVYKQKRYLSFKKHLTRKDRVHYTVCTCRRKEEPPPLHFPFFSKLPISKSSLPLLSPPFQYATNEKEKRTLRVGVRRIEEERGEGIRRFDFHQTLYTRLTVISLEVGEVQ